MTKVTDTLKTEIHYLLFGIRRSVRYHARRRMFFDRWNMLTSAVGVIFGSAAVASLWASLPPIFPISAALMVTGFSAVDLVVGSANAARLHHDLARRHIGLEKRLELEEHTEDLLKEIRALRLDIEADEPPVLRMLDTLCYNELAQAMDYDSTHFKPITKIQTMLANFVDFGEALEDKRKQEC